MAGKENGVKVRIRNNYRLAVFVHCSARTVTIRRGRLGAGRLGAADYAPGLLCAWTFRRRDF